MKILFVEDHDGFARDLEPVLRQTPGVDNVLRVIDRESAETALRDEQIDLVILDLSIPPNSTVNSPNPEHGQALFHAARELLPGTPIFILTGAEVEKFSRGLARFGNQVKLWGDSKEIETVSFFLKEEVDDLLLRVRAVAEVFVKMNSIAINTRGRDLGLMPIQNQMLKSFANLADGVACDVSLLSGGLSDAKVVKVAAMDKGRRPQALCAGKLGSASVIRSEIEAYEKHARKLGIGACPQLYCAVDVGVGMHGAIFYTLTDDDTAPLFDRLKADPSIGPAVVERVRSGLIRWSEAAIADMVTVADIRRRLIGDDEAAAIEAKFDLGQLREVEERTIQASQSCIHGDLHCGNVLVKSDCNAVLIDFGDAGPGFTSIDPIALELSLVFHPDSVKLGLDEGLLSNLDAWSNLDEFVQDHTLKPMIVACRNWAHDVGGGDQSVIASAYAYAYRQLKYDTVDPGITLAFVAKLSERLARA
ncbi:phosphotransferase [Donghicola tyrosinivorans]|uniref:Response regulator receiver domain-containing protein n=1 Tax=Donghicola tyrosinivorans TaxID=1652492 RepID=A0A2T0WYG5_9RHOB|nr:phosphotransferase [Donghicola tyrosinivorans]PRY91736.1 response regulator receiver domain-containing protein [Donghicola tyrosinivorans]